MKAVIAPNAFKDSMTAAEAAQAIQTGILRVAPETETVLVPVADGGDGLLDVMRAIWTGEEITRCVHGPLHEKRKAAFCWFRESKTAVVEMARASGLALLSRERRDVMKTSTTGTGELIKSALDQGAAGIYAGIGGSATNDGGTGMAAALGVRFLDQSGKVLNPCGENLSEIYRIDMSGLDERVRKTKIDVVCDVDNPLLGERGAACVYAPQKGASPEQVERLEKGLANLAAIIRRDIGIEVTEIKGGGAAGGLGAGLYAFLGARLRPGIDLILELVGLEEKMKGADIVFTAEGYLDSQTANAKAPAGVALMAKKNGIPCIALGGGVEENIPGLQELGMTAAFSICPAPVSLETAMQNGTRYLSNAAEQVFRVWIRAVNKELPGDGIQEYNI